MFCHVSTRHSVWMLRWDDIFFQIYTTGLDVITYPGTGARHLARNMQFSALTQRGVLFVAALSSALAGAQLTHVILKPDTRIPEYKPRGSNCD